MSQKETLKPCPMCNKAESLRISDVSFSRGVAWVCKWKLSCDHCCLDLFAPSREEVIKRWNTRAETPNEWAIRADERRKAVAFARNAFKDEGWNGMYRNAAETIASGLESPLSAVEADALLKNFPPDKSLLDEALDALGRICSDEVSSVQSNPGLNPYWIAHEVLTKAGRK